MDKKQLRSKLRGFLSGLSREELKAKSSYACQNLLSLTEFQEADTIMMFLSMPAEIDTTEAIVSAWQQGKTVLVPKVCQEKGRMIAVEINSLEDGLTTDPAGLRNPISDVAVTFERIDLVVTPGLGFDRTGHRLGRGGGYYDRFLDNRRLLASKCGFGFSQQIVDSVPISQHDRSVDFLVTDEEVVYCNMDKF
ncbi:5-formyltetrahydrofolate cyclo-ligase [Planctomycetota bacterium]